MSNLPDLPGVIIGDTSVERMTADITTLEVDAIVNAANSDLLGGGGVCGAIFQAAGWRDMEHACHAVAPCRRGMAKSTPAFKLPARNVIHAVGPIWHGGNDDEAAFLHDTYISILREAERLGARTVAIPGISTGIYGFPPAEAAAARDRALNRFLTNHPGVIDRVILVDYPRPTRRPSIGAPWGPGSLFDDADDFGSSWSAGGTRTRTHLTRADLAEFVSAG